MSSLLQAIYCARAELQPVIFEGWLANGIAAGGQLTTTTDVENFPGFPDGIMGPELCNKFREQSLRFGTRIFTETVNKLDLSKRPFKVWTDEKEVTAQTVIVATGAVAKRLPFKGSDEETGFWNKGISACAVCDGAAPIFRNKPIAVIGGGDSAMEEAMFLTKYGSEVSQFVYVVVTWYRLDYVLTAICLTVFAKLMYSTWLACLMQAYQGTGLPV